MKLFLNMLLIFSLLMLSVSCTQDPSAPPSEAKKATAGAVAHGISSAVLKLAGPCKQEQLVRDYYTQKSNEWFKINVADEKGILGVMCSTAVKAILPLAIQGTVKKLTKPEWECSGQLASDSISSVASLACSFIPL